MIILGIYKPYNFSHAGEKQRLSCHIQTLQLFPRSLVNYKPYSFSHAAEQQRFSCHLQTLQFFPRNRKTMIFLAITKPTVVPTQQKNNDFLSTYKPYNCSHATEKQRFSCQLQSLQLFPRGSKTTIFWAFRNLTIVPTQ